MQFDKESAKSLLDCDIEKLINNPLYRNRLMESRGNQLPTYNSKIKFSTTQKVATLIRIFNKIEKVVMFKLIRI